MSAPDVPVPLDEAAFTTLLGRIASSFAVTLLLVAGVSWLIVDGPTVSARGLVVGGALGLISWVASTAGPGLVLGREPVPRDVPQAQGVVRTAFMVGLAVTEVPALLAFVAAFVWPPDVTPVTVAAPAAALAMWLNLGSPGAVRRLLERAQG